MVYISMSVSDAEDDDVLEQIRDESTCDWCETWNRVLYEWQVTPNNARNQKTTQSYPGA